MWGYKYVKFSRSTAKQNPEMIKNAYLKVIEQKRKELDILNNREFTANIKIDSPLSKYLIDNHREFKNSFTAIEIKLNSEEIIKLYSILQNKYKKELEIREEMGYIRMEFSKFKTKFIRYS